jgi:DNA adenine methylase
MPAILQHTNKEIIRVKPFLKWAGGKGQLLNLFRELYPLELKNNQIKNYYEPFLGSGAVFIDIVQKFKIEHAYLCDVNEELVLTWLVIQKDIHKLIEALFSIEKKYDRLDKEKRKAYYYQQRDDFNTERSAFNHNRYVGSWIKRAAQIIFLNRTCFNGLFRVNSKGAFNTPAGEYANPTICDEQNLLAISKLLDKATIQKKDFNEALKNVKPSSFIYFDPPYRPISKTALFTAYSKFFFADQEQIRLGKLFEQLDKKGAKMMLSNSDPKNIDPKDNFFDDLYKGFNIIRVPAKRLINSKVSARGNINEIIVTNYPVG